MIRSLSSFSVRCCYTIAITRPPTPMFFTAHCMHNLARPKPSANICRYSAGFAPRPGRRRRIHFPMTAEEKQLKLTEIEKMNVEKLPEGLFAKCKFYFKRYWYIAIPVHTVVCTVWFVGLYFAVKSGVDVIGLLEMLHLPDSLVEKVKSTPPSAGVFVVALLLYKIAIPLRYATSLAGIQLTFWTLRRLGKLKTVREVEFGVRSGIEKKYVDAIRRLNERRNRSAANNIANSTSSSSASKGFSRKGKSSTGGGGENSPPPPPSK